MYRTRAALRAGHIKLRADRGSDDDNDAVLSLLPLFGLPSTSNAPASMMIAVGLCGALNRMPSMLVAVVGKASVVSTSELCLALCKDGGSRERVGF